MTARIVGGTADIKTSGGITQSEIFDFQRLYGNSILIDENNSQIGIFTSPSTYTFRVGGTLHANSNISSGGSISATGSITTNGTIGNLNNSNFRGADLQINGAATVGSVVSSGQIGTLNAANFRGADLQINGAATVGSVVSSGQIGTVNAATFRGANITVNGNGSFGSVGTDFFSCDGVTINAGNVTTNGTIGTPNQTSFRGNNITVNALADVRNIKVFDKIETSSSSATHSIQGNMGLFGNLGVGGNITANSGTISCGNDIFANRLRSSFWRAPADLGAFDIPSEIFLGNNDASISWGPPVVELNPYRLQFRADSRLSYEAQYLDGGGFPQWYFFDIAASPSDERLKTNITIANTFNILDSLMEIPVVYFDWKDKTEFGKDREVGFIAQDVEKKWPEFVKVFSRDRFEDGTKMLDKPRMMPMAFAAIQELKKQLDEAKEEIKDLKSRI